MFDICDVVCNWSISLLQPFVLDYLPGLVYVQYSGNQKIFGLVYVQYSGNQKIFE